MNDARYLLFKNLSIKNQKLKKKTKKQENNAKLCCKSDQTKLSLFRMSLIGAAHGWETGKKTLLP